MKTNFTTIETALILKSMFVLLSDNFSVSDQDISFLNEFAEMGSDFQSIDYMKLTENWGYEYNSQPDIFLKNFFEELSEAQIDLRTKQTILIFAGGILEQSENTFHRLLILKCIRAKLNMDDNQIPEDYLKYQKIALRLDIICQFLDRHLIDESTLFIISNEHNPTSATNLITANNKLPKAGKKWWQKLFRHE